MKPWALGKKGGNEDESKEKDTADPAPPAPEKPVVVKVPARPLLDVAVTMERSNPGCWTTLLSTVVTAAVMGLCFVVVGVPPIFLDDWKGKRIYVGMMVPILTLLCTVLLYYVMQQPQRAFNTALLKLVKEMEHHSNYLSLAVDNVEKELNARGVNLNSNSTNNNMNSTASANNYYNANGTNASSFAARARDHLATPEESAMARSPGQGPITPKAGLQRSSSSFYPTGGTDFLHGMNKLDESHDITIATVHVGKEWKWFTETLGQLRKTLTGPNFTGLAHQRLMVRMLTTAVARVEKLILSLYFSSFLLQRLNILAPLNLWGTSALGVAGNRADPHARAVAALARNTISGHYTNHNLNGGGGSPGVAPLRLLGGSGTSLTESTFTLGNVPSKGSGGGGGGGGGAAAAEPESPAFSTSARATIDVQGDDETHTELTPPSQAKGFMFGNKVKLPQFTPLMGSGEMTPKGKAPPANAAAAATAVATTGNVAGGAAETKQADRAQGRGNDVPDSVVAGAAPPVVSSTQRRMSVSTSAAALPLQRSVTKVGGGGGDAGDSHEMSSERQLRSASEVSGTGEDIDADGVATPVAHVRSDRQASPKDGASHSVVVVQNRLTAAEDENGNAPESLVNGSRVPEARAAASGRGATAPAAFSAATSKAASQQQTTPRHFDATPKNKQQQLASFDTTDAPFAAFSPPPIKPPLSPSPSLQQQQQLLAGTNGRPRRQPGSAVVQNPTLVLRRGARFVNDEESFFMTILIHVRKANLTCFSRLYAAQAHVKDDGTDKKYYFANIGDSSAIRRGNFNPFTLFHIADVGGEREGLTVQEQRLLNFVYCRPEHHSALAESDTGGSGLHHTDLSSLAVKDGASSAGSPVGPEETASPPSSLPQRNVTSVYAEEVDAFIVALGILADRPMRLTFLSVHVEAVSRSKGLSGTFSASMSSLSPKAGPTLTKSSEAGATSSEADAFLPPVRTLPVLECVIDDVLCVLTKIEVTVDAAFKKPSKILLVGVSLEDLSEGSERGVDEEDEDDLDSLAAAQETKKPNVSSPDNSPNDRHSRSMATPQVPALGSNHNNSGGRAAAAAVAATAGYNHTCTVGQEFREVLVMGEQDSMTTEPSQASA